MFAYITGVAASLIFLVTATKIVDLIIKAPGYGGRPSDHFDGKHFHNLSKAKGRTLIDVLKWAVTKDETPWEDRSSDESLIGPPPEAGIDDGTLGITFVNHATFLIQADGLNILTDPVWSKRASPFQWIGPRRMRPPGIRFEDLPDIDLVLISHNHYDHLDIHTVRRLHQKHDPLFVVPLGVGNWLNGQGIHRTAELDWWEEETIGEGGVTAVPAQHFSGRGLSDRDRTLWCGYVLELPSGTTYFAGDTGYDDFFRDIGNSFSIDLGLIPIGAYKPRWFMTPIHVDPHEAVQAHRDIGASTSIGMHFGTFPLADEGCNEPLRELKKARKDLKVADTDFGVLGEGEQHTYRFNEALAGKQAV